MNGAHHPNLISPIFGAFQRVGNGGAGAHHTILGVGNGGVGVRDIMANHRGCYACRFLLEAEY